MNANRRLWLVCFSLVLQVLSSACSPRPRPIRTPEQPKVASPIQDDAIGTRWLIDTARSAASAGAGVLDVVAFGSGSAGDSVNGLIFVPKGRCALVYARGSSSVEDLDLVAYGDDGSQYGLDEAPDDLPTLLICPEEDARLFLAARIALGEGFAAIGMQDLGPTHAKDVARAAGARGYFAQPRDVEEPWPGLAEALTNHRRAMGGSWTDRRRVALPVDSRVPTKWTVIVPAEQCLDVFVLPAPEVTHVQLTAEDEKGRIFARGKEEGRNRSLFLCAGKQASSVTLELRPQNGRGLAVAAMSTTRTSADVAEIDRDFKAYLLASSTQTIADTPAWRKSAWKKKVQLKVGTIETIELQLEGCGQIELAPMAPLLGYAVHGWDRQGTLLGETEAQWLSPLFICLEGSVRLDFEATQQAGPLRLSMTVAKKSPKALLEAPLAASRLLARAYQAGLIQSPGELHGISGFDLSSKQLQRVHRQVPARHCETIVIAREGEGYGLEARAWDSQENIEIQFVRGARSVQLQLCAPYDAPLAALVEMRTIRGKGHALWASHLSELSFEGH